MFPIVKYVEHITEVHRDKGASISPEKRDKAEAELDIYRKWFNEHVMKRESDSLSDAILVMPEGKAVPQYRDDPNA